MAGDRSRVVAHAIDEAGNATALEAQQLGDAQEAGFKPISATEAAIRAQANADSNYVDQNYGTAGKALLGAADGATLGIGPALAVRGGLLDAGHLDAARQSGAYTAGDIAGTLLPAFLSGGSSLEARGAAEVGGSRIARALAGATPAGMLGEAGGLAERAVGAFLPEAGIMGKGAQTTIKMAARGASEGALMNLAHTASDDIITNKPLTAQALLASGAEGALFGGLAGGILGGGAALASAGIESGGGRLLGAATKGGERAAGVALKRIGMEGELEAIAKAGVKEGAVDGPFVGSLREYHDLMQKSGTSFAAPTSHIRESVQRAVAEHETIMASALKELGEIQKPGEAPLARLLKRFDTEEAVMYRGTADQTQAAGIYKQLRRDLAGNPTKAFSGKAPSEFVPQKVGSLADHAAVTAKNEAGLKSYKEALAKHEEALASHAGTERLGGMKTWEDWAKNRTILADRAKAEGLKGDIYKAALNAFDDEFQKAGTAVDEAAFKKYAASATGKRVGEALVEGTGKRMAAEANKGNPLHMTHTDGGTMGMGMALGHPVGAAGVVLARKIAGYAQDKLEPVIAEYAARSALGSAAGAATANAGNRIAGALKGFMTGVRVSTEKANANEFVKPPKLSYTMKAYQQQMELADQLTSAAHQEKVRETVKALSMAGHGELANEMQQTYGRAVAYVNQNVPKHRGKAAKDGSLTKPPKQIGLSTQDMKFLRQLHSMRDPVGFVVDGLEKGNLSRDGMATIQNVLPDFHMEFIVKPAMQMALQMRQEGKFLPADKLALLGCAVNYAVDSKLTPEFIGEVQKGLAMNKKPQPAPGGTGPAPVTDISQYQTPLQSSV